MKLPLLLILLSPLISSAQLSVSPVLGIDYMNLKRSGYEGPESIRILDKGFKNGSIVYGLEIGSTLTNKLRITSKSSFTHKKVSAIKEANFIDIEGIKFDLIETNIGFQYVLSNIYLSAGYQLDYIKHMQYLYQSDGLSFKENINGLVLGLGLNIKRFSINAYYFNSFNNVIIEKYILLAPVKTLGIYMSYVLIKNEGFVKKVKCPRV